MATHSLEVGLSIPEAWKTFNPRLAFIIPHRRGVPPVLIRFCSILFLKLYQNLVRLLSKNFHQNWNLKFAPLIFESPFYYLEKPL